VQFPPLDEVIELHAERRLPFNRHEAVERAARLAHADILEHHPIKRERAPHSLRRPIQDGPRILRG
jgi:hypothetical protein